MTILEQLQLQFPQMENLRVRSIKVDKPMRLVTCVVSYPNMPELDKPIRESLRATVRSCIPDGFKTDVQLVNDRFNQNSFSAFVLDYIKHNYPLFSHIKAERLNVSVVGKEISATFNVSPSTKRNMEVAEFIEQFSQYLRDYTSYNVTLSVAEDETATVRQADIDEQQHLVQLAINRELLRPQRFFNVYDVQKYIGKPITVRPMYISDIRKTMDSCVVCGHISNKELRPTKNNPTLKLCKFNLTDDSGATIPCVMFVRFEVDDLETLKQASTGKSEAEILTLSKKRRLANDRRMKLLTFLSDGLEVLVRGKVVYNDFSERLEMQLFDISKCRIEPLNRQPKFESPLPENYLLVKPQQIEEYRQLTITQTKEKPSFLSGKDVVVLAANVTGYNLAKDKLFGICAVRLVNGHLREKFSSCVDPECKLTDGQMAEGGVSAREVASSPSLTEIIPDLVKFLQGSTLIGNNTAQLLQLLNYYAAPLGFNLKNAILPQTEVLSKMFSESTFTGSPNFADLTDFSKAVRAPQTVSPSCFQQATVAAQMFALLAEHVK